MYPLKFQPLFRRYLWGGIRLANMLGKPTGSETCAESWEIVDHAKDQSVVQNGLWTGKTLSQLVHESGRELLGPDILERITNSSRPDQLRGRFPLLLKFLDANQNLSVQVHPDDAMAATLEPPDLGKNEAWYVMHSDPGSKIFAGLKSGVTRQDLLAGIGDGTTEELLHSFEPKQGDCVQIRAGTLHAIGAGLLIAEIQQASDTTFRVFDWNRVDTNGRPRDLHIEQSLAAIDFERGPVNPVMPMSRDGDGASLLVANDHFEMRKWTLSQPVTMNGPQVRMLAVTQGSVAISAGRETLRLQTGGTALIPYSCANIVATPLAASEMLDISIPESPGKGVENRF